MDKDTSFQQLTQDILKKNHNFFEAIANQSAEGVSVADVDGNYIYANETFCSMVGYSIDELLQMTVFDLKSEVQDKTSFSRTKSSKEGLPVQVYLKRKDGSEFFSEVLGKVIDLGDRTIILGIVRDISHALNHDDERLDFERYSQYSQKLKSLEMFAGGIAHDFNNLLMVILGHAELASLKLPANSPAINHLQLIDFASKQAARLSQQMLAYTGKGLSVIEAVSFEKIIDSISQDLATIIKDNVTIQYDMMPDLPTFNGDVSQIGQMIINIMTNAAESITHDEGIIKFSSGTMHCDRDYLDSTVTATRAVTNEPLKVGAYAFCEIEDNGIGIDEQTVEKMFDPFFTTKFTGRGLGTSVVLGVVRAHHGAIKIESQLGVGTKFRVLFRVEQDANELAGERNDSAVEAGTNKATFNGMVLLVDDEKMVLDVGFSLLESLGFTVITASNGEEAIKLFTTHCENLQCVMLDLVMPGIDGEQTFIRLKEINDKVPVILCSGYSETDATSKLRSEGLAGFIQKPYNLNTLTNMLARVF